MQEFCFSSCLGCCKVWTFWKDLEDNGELHPDGLEQCPPETYTVMEDDSRNNSKVRCFPCPVCPAGEEPSPPCGITLAVKAFGLALSDIPPNLETILIIKLDVYHNGELGWKKLGNAFGVDKDKLNYMQLSYQMPGGSPTKDLLEILDSQDRNVADLINKLQSPNVNRPDVALLVRQHIASGNN